MVEQPFITAFSEEMKNAEKHKKNLCRIDFHFYLCNALQTKRHRS